MGSPINITSSGEWVTLVKTTNVVVADFYADWCGPCKMIAPHFESLAKEHTRPKKVAFAKINVDSQSMIAKGNGVSAMPTFKIFHGGVCVETIKGANPPALTQAVENWVKVAESGKRVDVFQSPGRTLGGETASGTPQLSNRVTWILNLAMMALGLYMVSLFSARPKKEE